MLLRRYGVVFRDLLARETNLPRWRELQIGFRRLEDRGEVRGGRFVSWLSRRTVRAAGRCRIATRESKRSQLPVPSCQFPVLGFGSQFSVLSSQLSDANGGREAPFPAGERSSVSGSAPMSGERVVISAADPLNLVGIIVPGERIPAISGRSVAFRDGVWDPEVEIPDAAIS